MAKHTPGPWATGTWINPDNPLDVALAVGPKGAKRGDGFSPVCLVTPLDKKDERDEANAQLIATAPELVEIAREVWRALDEVRCRDARWLGPKLRELHTRLGHVVAKAEGQEVRK